MHATNRLVLGFCLALWACDGNTTSHRNDRDGARVDLDGARLVNVSGEIYLGDSPVAGAAIALVGDGLITAEAQTDEAGQFFISDVAQGKYQFAATLVAGDNVFQYSKAITADKDVTIGKVAMKPWSLTAEAAAPQSIRLTWAPFRGKGFYEYRVFRSTQPVVQDAPDENTGPTETIHLATDADATEYIDDTIVAGRPYYYRVIAYSVDRKLGGTNITSATTPRWPDSIPTKYRLRFATSYSISSGGSLAGFDYDGQYLWIVSVDYTAGYYTDDIVTLHQYDPVTRATVKSYTYTDDYVGDVNLACGGGKLWLSSDPSDNAKLKVIDAASGSVTAVYPLSAYDYGESAADGSRLFFAHAGIRVMSHTFTFVDQWGSPFGNGAGGTEGLAYRPGELWIGDRLSRQFAILNDSGDLIGVTEDVEYIPSFHAGYDAAFMNNQLLVLVDGLIYVYDIEALE